jgi:hypothetical protein
MKALVLGMGNPILSDDGVGVRLAHSLDSPCWISSRGMINCLSSTPSLPEATSGPFGNCPTAKGGATFFLHMDSASSM